MNDGHDWRISDWWNTPQHWDPAVIAKSPFQSMYVCHNCHCFKRVQTSETIYALSGRIWTDEVPSCDELVILNVLE